ncbi:hypothetical protein B2G71_03040 [Novosphingobium sp. PC22D]|uniref:hypothetical protein n=1 Tax=Novosphingobium sp. PC22D TaxID=1962403 RepID=UPI000BEF7952|nr:hypothetical protein [Novosphingobium sp. PC22D]PEQ14564.1 hypothetical protein B2G71_03040 [Novosphingobium sp. PC22D]
MKLSNTKPRNTSAALGLLACLLSGCSDDPQRSLDAAETDEMMDSTANAMSEDASDTMDAMEDAAEAGADDLQTYSEVNGDEETYDPDKDIKEDEPE